MFIIRVIESKSIAFFLLLIFIINIDAYSKNTENMLYPSKRNKNLFEIDNIEFQGNKNFTHAELSSVLFTRTTRRNTVHKILEFYYFEFNKIQNINSYLPPGALFSMEKTLDRWSPEIQYYEELKVDADLMTLKEFYNQNGFHETTIHFSFEADTIKKKNVLEFSIKEGPRYSISNIKFLGLDDVANEIKKQYAGKFKTKKGNYFNEDDVVSDVNIIQMTLLNNGYYYASYQQPVVSRDSIKKTDSITINFNPGTRQRISSIVFVDSTFGQKIVTDVMKTHQLFFKNGDWYSRKNVESSRQNLQSLGTFELVSIDTSSHAGIFTDSTLPIMVYTRYRKQQEWGLGLYYNITAIDNINNVGIEASYLNRNIGGIAQSLNLFTRLELKDISRYFDAEPEWQLGISYAQPFLWKINNSTVGLSGQLMHAESKIMDYLRLSTTSLSVRFPTKLPAWTYFNSLSFDLLIEWQNPTNFESAFKDALDDAKTDSSKYIVEETFRIYKTLFDEIKSSPALKPTAFIFGYTMTGDTRNELFNPINGYYTSISTDIWAGIGIAKYWRTQYSYSQFSSINKYTVFAFKARAGYIHWWDRDNSYIPRDRQFFAGGANSNRGWESRRLRYFTDRVLFVTTSQSIDYAMDNIGSRGILEGSFELRWRFGKPRWTSDAVAEIINYGVMTGFIDWGNTFHWIAFSDDEYYTELKFIDYLKGIAVSAGLGLGFQTPVGPLRFDAALPIYDPTPFDNLNKMVFTRNFALQYWQYHIGLGYSF